MSTPRELGHGCTNCYALPDRHRPELGSRYLAASAQEAAGQQIESRATSRLVELQHSGGLAEPTALRNQFDPFDIAWYDARQERNGGAITVDQRLTSNITFYGSGFYSLRRGHLSEPVEPEPGGNNIDLPSSRSRRSIRTTRWATRRTICARTTISVGKARASRRSTSSRSATSSASISRFPAIGAAASGTR